MTGTEARNGTEARLARVRGRTLPRRHNARTIAALASNPGCVRRAILDAAGVDKQRIAAYAGYPAPFGQSRFALARGNAFEAQLKADGAAELLTLLRNHLNLPIPEAHYDDLNDVGGNTSPDLRHGAGPRRARGTRGRRVHPDRPAPGPGRAGATRSGATPDPGIPAPATDLAEAAALLRAAARLRAEVLGEAV